MKPIFTVKIPNTCTSEKEVREMQQALKDQLHDYHVIVVATKVDVVTFECFYPQ
jgi:hypothetical protein